MRKPLARVQRTRGKDTASRLAALEVWRLPSRTNQLDARRQCFVLPFGSPFYAGDLQLNISCMPEVPSACGGTDKTRPAERKNLRQLRARDLHAEVSTWNRLRGTNLSATWQSANADPRLCVPASRRVCLFRGSLAHQWRLPIELLPFKKETSNYSVEQQSSQ